MHERVSHILPSPSFLNQIVGSIGTKSKDEVNTRVEHRRNETESQVIIDFPQTAALPS